MTFRCNGGVNHFWANYRALLGAFLLGGRKGKGRDFWAESQTRTEGLAGTLVSVEAKSGSVSEETHEGRPDGSTTESSIRRNDQRRQQAVDDRDAKQQLSTHMTGLVRTTLCLSQSANGATGTT